MSEQLPPAFAKLRDQLREAAERDIEIERRVAQRVGRARRRHWLLIGLAAAAAGGGVAVAERARDREGAARPTTSVPASAAGDAAPGIVTSSATADPDGGPPWALRVFSNPAGLDCVAIGRLSGGKLGSYDELRTFHPLQSRRPGACGRLATVGLLVAVQQRSSPLPRTIVYGLARDREAVRVTIGERTRSHVPGALGSFIDVRSGILDLQGASTSTTLAGEIVRHPLG